MDIGNLISALMALNEMGDKARLGAALFRLGRFFSYIQEDEASVTLRDECRFLEHFIELERLRFDGRPSFSIRVPEEMETAKIPRYSLFSALHARLERRLERTDGPVAVLVDCRTEIVSGSATLVAIFSFTEKRPAGSFRRANEAKEGGRPGI